MNSVNTVSTYNSVVHCIIITIQFGDTPLHKVDHIQVTKLLLSRGADVNTVNEVSVSFVDKYPFCYKFCILYSHYFNNCNQLLHC